MIIVNINIDIKIKYQKNVSMEFTMSIVLLTIPRTLSTIWTTPFWTGILGTRIFAQTPPRRNWL